LWQKHLDFQNQLKSLALKLYFESHSAIRLRGLTQILSGESFMVAHLPVHLLLLHSSANSV
jgi:hypothetical protein